jgi:hypothetical protein
MIYRRISVTLGLTVPRVTVRLLVAADGVYIKVGVKYNASLRVI